MARKRAAINPDLFAKTEPTISRPVEDSTSREIEDATHREIEDASTPRALSYRRMAFDLSAEVSAALEAAYAQARATATGDRRKVSRSAIVEQALKAWLGLE